MTTENLFGYSDLATANAVRDALRTISPVFAVAQMPDANGKYWVTGSREFLRFLSLTGIAFPPFKTREVLEKRLRQTIADADREDAPTPQPKIRPVPRQVYAFDEIDTLDLGDIPCLLMPINVEFDGQWAPVQTSHTLVEEMVDQCPAWKDTSWMYFDTNAEGVPVFYFQGGKRQRDKVVDVVRSTNPHNTDGWWVTPKGCPRAE